MGRSWRGRRGYIFAAAPRRGQREAIAIDDGGRHGLAGAVEALEKRGRRAVSRRALEGSTYGIDCWSVAVYSHPALLLVANKVWESTTMS